MAAYDPAVIQGYLAIVDNPPNGAAKGKAFEDLACYLLNGIPGIKITARNEMNTFATEEIDVACKNENDPAGLGGLVDFFLVECKGWRDAASFGIKMVIVTREEIEKLTSGEDFAELIIQKVCTLHASGGRCY